MRVGIWWLENLRVFLWEENTADEGAALSEYGQKSETCTSFGVTLLVIEQPGNVDGKRREDTTASQPDPEVANASLALVFNGSKQQISDTTHGGEECDNKSSLAPSVGEEGDSNAAEKCSEVGRGSETLSGDGVVAHVMDDGGEEVRQALKTN